MAWGDRNRPDWFDLTINTKGTKDTKTYTKKTFFKSLRASFAIFERFVFQP